MKTKTWIILILSMLVLSLGASFFMLRPQGPAAFAEIISDGNVVHTLSLHADQSITIPAPNGGSNTVTVSGGRIAVTEATCPDHYCMHRGYRDSGSQIVCLPNRLVIRFLGQQETDISVG